MKLKISRLYFSLKVKLLPLILSVIGVLLIIGVIIAMLALMSSSKGNSTVLVETRNVFFKVLYTMILVAIIIYTVFPLIILVNRDWKNKDAEIFAKRELGKWYYYLILFLGSIYFFVGGVIVIWLKSSIFGNSNEYILILSIFLIYIIFISLGFTSIYFIFNMNAFSMIAERNESSSFILLNHCLKKINKLCYFIFSKVRAQTRFNILVGFLVGIMLYLFKYFHNLNSPNIAGKTVANVVLVISFSYILITWSAIRKKIPEHLKIHTLTITNSNIYFQEINERPIYILSERPFNSMNNKNKVSYCFFELKMDVFINEGYETKIVIENAYAPRTYYNEEVNKSCKGDNILLYVPIDYSLKYNQLRAKIHIAHNKLSTNPNKGKQYLYEFHDILIIFDIHKSILYPVKKYQLESNRSSLFSKYRFNNLENYAKQGFPKFLVIDSKDRKDNNVNLQFKRMIMQSSANIHYFNDLVKEVNIVEPVEDSRKIVIELSSN